VIISRLPQSQKFREKNDREIPQNGLNKQQKCQQKSDEVVNDYPKKRRSRWELEGLSTARTLLQSLITYLCPNSRRTLASRVPTAPSKDVRPSNGDRGPYREYLATKTCDKNIRWLSPSTSSFGPRYQLVSI
jgi:hypothetical protein